MSLRAQLPPETDGGPMRWYMVRQDVFSTRNASVADCADPIVHEIKVHRSGLLDDEQDLLGPAA